MRRAAVGLLPALTLLLAGCLGSQPSGPDPVTTAEAPIVMGRDTVDIFGGWIVTQRAGTSTKTVNGTRVAVDLGGIYLHSIPDGSGTRIALNGTSPRVSGTHAIWVEGRAIRSYDLITGEQGTVNRTADPLGPPAISGHRVVWVRPRVNSTLPEPEHDPLTDLAVYSFKTNTTMVLPLPPSPKGIPDVDGRRVVWADARNGSWDIYRYDLDTGNESLVSDAPDGQFNPRIAGEWVVWLDNRDTPVSAGWRMNLYGVDLSTGVEQGLTDNGKVVAFDLDPTWAVYEVTTATPSGESSDIRAIHLGRLRDRAIATGGFGQWSPAVHGERLVWAQDSVVPSQVFSVILTTERPAPGVLPQQMQGPVAAIIIACIAVPAFLWWYLESEVARRRRRRGE